MNTKIDYTKASTLEDLQAIADMQPLDTHWTYTLLQEVFPVEYKAKLEIIHNRLYIMPNPTPKHQEIVFELSILLRQFVKANHLGKIYIAPLDVRLDANNLVAPDILFVSVERQEIIHEKRIEGTPDLLVEVISPANYPKKRREKIALYEQFGIREYWEIYPKKKKCIVHALQEGKFIVFSEASKTGKVKSSVLQGLEVELEKFLEG